jgi:hypothetical protein
VRATGKDPQHISSTNACDACHSTTAWSPAVQVDHAEVLGSCASCHDGTHATGKPADHLPTTLDCDACHVATAWLPARFDHTGVQAGSCASCHDGTRATGKPADHIATTASCDACHSTIAWLPAQFDHANVAPGTCNQCHNGTSATGKPPNHWVTNRSCDFCHNTTAWQPVAHVHESANYPGDHRPALQCTDCHRTSRNSIPWPAPAYQPDCAGCHAGDFESGPHNKTEQGVKYTVSELRNCSGSCHVYTDSTLTTIKERRNGPEHRVTSGEF